jgi:hypothetical protein
MNDGENNRMVLGDTPGIIYSDHPLPISLARSLTQAVLNPDIMGNARFISDQVTGRSWDEGLNQAERIIIEKATGQRDG